MSHADSGVPQVWHSGKKLEGVGGAVSIKLLFKTRRLGEVPQHHGDQGAVQGLTLGPSGT